MSSKLVAAISLLLTLQQCCQAFPPPYHPPPPILPISSERCRPDQSIALLQFKNSFDIFEEDDDKMASWKDGSDCCLWEGVTCDPFTGHVIGLHLACDQIYPYIFMGGRNYIPPYTPCRRFKGTLHPDSSLFHLRSLQSLDLSNNDFNGSTIPSTLTRLISLTHLNLSLSRFSGHIPLELSHLNKLVSLDLSYNWPHHVDQERELSFGDSDDFSKLLLNATELSELQLSGVNMSNIKPSSFSNLSHSLTCIELSSCRLIGSFPESVFRLPNLQEFILSNNAQLSVQFPFSNWTAHHLKVLDLSYTNFSRQIMIPASIGNLKSLERLVLENCSLSGSILASIGNLTSLTYLNLDDNSLPGEFADILPNLVQLEYLSLGGNKFSGWFPDIFGNLSKKLTALGISNNNFTGYIPSFLFNQLPKLQSLHCSNNQLVGPLPSEVVNIGLNNIQVIYLSDNLLNGTIPSWMLALPSLHVLDLSYNLLTGSLSIPWSPWLSYLSVANNKLSPQLRYFSVANNKLTGRMPYHICNLTTLDVIDLSSNNLSGSIPECFVNLTKLGVLNLRMNNFHGSIPSIFGNMRSLRNLDLNGNTLGGSLSQSLTACNFLEVLDVGNNNINDVFPQWLSSLPELKVLILHSNHFHGPITAGSLAPMNSFPMLRILDISNNHFNGLLPASLFHKFPAMTMLQEFEKAGVNFYIGRQRYAYSIVLTLKGQEIMLIKILTIITSVDLSNNNFHGGIPDTIGELKSLKLLNLSHNSFSGPIPSSLGNLTELESLDLSCNQLTGPIPQGSQIQTIDNTCYVGNEGLCGFSLSKECEVDDDDDDGALFDWVFADAGYGCGLVIGISTYLIMFIIRKPRWLVEMVEEWTWRRLEARRWRRPITF